MRKIDIILDIEHNNMLNNLLAEYEGSMSDAISDIIEYYYNNRQHPRVKVEQSKIDSCILDGIVLSEKDAQLVKQLLLEKKTRAEKELSNISYKEGDSSWWHNGSKVQADYACKLQYDSINAIKQCDNIVKAIDELIEQRVKHDA